MSPLLIAHLVKFLPRSLQNAYLSEELKGFCINKIQFLFSFRGLCPPDPRTPHHSEEIVATARLYRHASYLIITERLPPGFRTLPYDERCALLGLDRLELRRLRADLVICYKIIRGLVLLSPDSFFTFVRNSRTRGHSFKLFSPDSRVNCRQHFFSGRVLRIWNSIPEDVVSAAQLSLFISRLVRVNLNQFLIGKM